MGSISIPVLMYHKVGAGTPQAPDKFINVTPHRFEKQIRFMLRRGYAPTTFAGAVQSLKSGNSERKFAVTFDDGYQVVNDFAAPILARLNVSATVFVVSDAVGKTNVWDRENKKPVIQLMDWDNLLRLRDAGWEVAGHTKSHPHLDRISEEDAVRELKESKSELEQILGSKVETFCYPYGDFAASTPVLVRNAGYSGACTTQSGIATNSCDPFLLPRVKISHSDDVAGLIYKLYLRQLLPNLRKNRR